MTEYSDDTEPTDGAEGQSVEINIIPNHLCEICLSLDFEFPTRNQATILCDDLDVSRDDVHSIILDPANPSGCRLCELLISRFCELKERNAPFVVKYGVALRYGYIMQERDLAFKPAEGDGVVRLSLQPHKPKEEWDPKMPRYETTIAASNRSTESFQQIESWLNGCVQNHSTCKDAFPQSNFVPTRLIRIMRRGEDDFAIRLIDGKTLNATVKYATLSHCWGNSMPYKLTKENLDSCMQEVSIEKVSKVFQDAIYVAARCDVWYIWIDSLCIIQDSLSDWRAESALMGSVYRHCFLNIASTGFADGLNGLFVERDPRVMTPIIHRDFYLADIHTWRNGVDYAALGTRAWATQERLLSVRTLHFGKTQIYWECAALTGNEVFPGGFVKGTRVLPIPKGFPALRQKTSAYERRTHIVNTIRGKVELFNLEYKLAQMKMQDSDSRDDGCAETYKSLSYVDSIMLQKKINEIEKQKEGYLLWTIKELDINLGQFRDLDVSFVESLPLKNKKELIKKLRKMNIMKPAPDGSSNGLGPCWLKGMEPHQRRWIFIVNTYSEANLSFSKDKLVALSGLAKAMSKDMGCQYVAGMWRKDLEHYLLWSIKRPRLAPKKDGTRGPSWSWASVDGKVLIDDWDGYFYIGIPGDIIWLSTVNDVDVKLASTAAFGQVSSGTLSLTGPLGVLRLERESVPPPSSGDENIVHKERKIGIYWDTLELEHRFTKSRYQVVWRYSTYGTAGGKKHALHDLDVFYLPFRMMGYCEDGHDVEIPKLYGLLLLPTDKKAGQYRRVGQFQLSEWGSENSPACAAFMNKTKILSSRYYEAEHKSGDYDITIV